jgi:hypothetical protein
MLDETCPYRIEMRTAAQRAAETALNFQILAEIAPPPFVTVVSWRGGAQPRGTNYAV